MNINDLLTQLLQYLLGVLPGNIASDIIAILSLLMAIGVVVMRFWKTEPDKNNKVLHFIYKAFFYLANLHLPKNSSNT